MKLAIIIVPVNSNVVFYDHSWRNILLYIYNRGISCLQSLESWLVCVKHMQQSAVMQLPLSAAMQYLVSCHAVVSSHVSCISSHVSCISSHSRIDQSVVMQYIGWHRYLRYFLKYLLPYFITINRGNANCFVTVTNSK